MKTKVLFITPVIPNLNGSGTEKRAHHWITSLRKKHQVELLLIGTCEFSEEFTSQDNVNSIKMAYGSLDRKFTLAKIIISMLTGSNIKSGSTAFGWFPLQNKDKLKLDDLYSGATFERIICFRTFCSDFAVYINKITNTRFLEIDSDDLESETRRKLSVLYFKNQQYLRSFKNKLASKQFFSTEKYLTQFDKIYLCSNEDKMILAARSCDLNICIFKNKIYIKDKITLPLPLHCRSVLFVGSLNYFPNEHAVLWFINNVFFKLKALNDEWIFNVVGFSGSAKLKAKLSSAGAILHSDLKSVEKAYIDNAIIVAPLFAGGGTKLKVLEAMSFKRPIIATSEAVHGLGLINEKHYVLANTAQEFINSCQRLSSDISYYNNILNTAYNKLTEDFSYSD